MGSRLRIGIVILCTIFVSILTSPAKAAPDIAQGLQIRPLIVDLNAEKGKTYNIEIKLLNVTTADLVYSGDVRDFRPADEAGTPKVLLDENLPPSSSVAGWVSMPSSIPLKTKQEKGIPVTIKVPSDAEPGGHYGIMRFSGVAPGLESTGVAVQASVGTLLLIRVNGQAKESLNVKEFFTERGSSKSVWFENGPVKLVERISNNGNVHVRPQGDVTVTNMFGKNVATLKVNELKGFVLPNGTRRFEQTLQKKWLFGRYKASMTLAYGTQGQVLMANTTFWVIPYKIIVVALLILLLIIFAIRFFIKRYNDKIIKKALDEKQRRR